MVGEKEYRARPRATKLTERGVSPEILVRANMNRPLNSVAAQTAFLLPVLSAMKPLETLAKKPAAGMSMATNPAVARVMPLYSTRKEGANVRRVLRQRL